MIKYEASYLGLALLDMTLTWQDQDSTVTISYDLHRRENQWRIYDLTIDGTSTAEGNRRRYERYIKKKSYEQLIGQLDKQLARLLESRQ